MARVRRLAEGPARPATHRGPAELTIDDAGLRAVIDGMADAGRVTRDGRRLSLPGTDAGLDPEMAAKVDRLLEGLREAGAEPPRVDGPAARLGIPPHVVGQLRRSGRLRSVAPGIDYPEDVWTAIEAHVAAMRGTIGVARLRDELRTSRRHAEAILAAVGRRPRTPRRRDRRAVE